MAHPFPDERITADVVTAQIKAGGWTDSKCPLCDAAAAVWRIENKDRFRYLCPTCQRFIISGSQIAALRREPKDPETVKHRKKLSEDAAAARDVADLG